VTIKLELEACTAKCEEFLKSLPAFENLEGICIVTTWGGIDDGLLLLSTADKHPGWVHSFTGKLLNGIAKFMLRRGVQEYAHAKARVESKEKETGEAGQAADRPGPG
jgi:hypothetical protein